MHVYGKFDWLQVESCMQEMDQRVQNNCDLCNLLRVIIPRSKTIMKSITNSKQ